MTNETRLIISWQKWRRVAQGGGGKWGKSWKRLGEGWDLGRDGRQEKVVDVPKISRML